MPFGGSCSIAGSSWRSFVDRLVADVMASDIVRLDEMVIVRSNVFECMMLV